MKALVVHTRRTGLGVIRSLGIKGLTVYAADTYASPGFYSKYVSNSFIIPAEDGGGGEELLSSLLHIGEKNYIGEKIFLFTASDDYLMFFATHAVSLSRYFIITSETEIELLVNSLLKVKMYQVAKRAGVDYPRTFYRGNIDFEGMSFPVIVKPSIRKKDGFDFGLEVFKVRVCKCHEELVDAIDLLEAYSFDFVVQEYIDGGDDQLYTAAVFSYKGQLVASSTARKIRQFPPVTGECSYGELVEEPELLISAEKFLSCAKITGICQLEFKKRGDRFYFMEINPRPWSWNSLIEYSGVNLPYIACLKLINPSDMRVYRQSKFSGNWIFSLMEIKYHIFGQGDLGVFRFLWNFIFAKRHAYLDWRDIRPLVFALRDFFSEPIRAWNHGYSPDIKPRANKSRVP